MVVPVGAAQLLLRAGADREYTAWLQNPGELPEGQAVGGEPFGGGVGQVVEYLVYHDPVQGRVLEWQLLDPGGVKRDAVSGPRQLTRGDLEHTRVHVHRLDPADVMEQRVGVVARAAAGIKHHRPVQRNRRVGEATDEDLGAHRLPGLVVVAGFACVVLVAAQFGLSPRLSFSRKSILTSVNSLRAKFRKFTFHAVG